MVKPGSSLVETITKQLFLIGLLAFFVGIVTIEAYCQQFGIKYTYYNFPINHYFYLGLKTIIKQKALLLVYFVGILIININIKLRLKYRAQNKAKTKFILVKINWNNIIVFCGIALLLLLSFYFARKVGFDAALKDMTQYRSTLAKIEYIKTQKTTKCYKNTDLRLLLLSNDHIISYKIVNNENDDEIRLIYFRKGDVDEIKTAN